MKGCNMVCEMCGMIEDDLKKFSNHLNSVHKLSSIEYTVKFLYNGFKHVCLKCGVETRYVSFEFKEYCKEHAKIKMSKAGRVGGLAPAWNRNKTKLTDERIARHAERVTGPGNHFWGKKHKEEINRIIYNDKEFMKKVKDIVDKTEFIEEFHFKRFEDTKFCKFWKDRIKNEIAYINKSKTATIGDIKTINYRTTKIELMLNIIKARSELLKGGDLIELDVEGFTYEQIDDEIVS
jgi:hypothetical protein